MQYLFSGISLKNKRPFNMDSLLLKYKRVSNEAVLLAVVCDGVGSLADGAFASGMAVRMLNGWFDQIERIDRIGLRLRDFILSTNTRIVMEARQNSILTATTLSALLLVGVTYYVVHIGDSRVYMYGDMLSLLTTDDVSETGKLTACIGQSSDITLQYREGSTLEKTFLVCSDGLYKRMNPDFMREKMQVKNKRMVKEAVKDLVRYAEQQGEQDNISAALIKIEM